MYCMGLEEFIWYYSTLIFSIILYSICLYISKKKNHNKMFVILLISIFISFFVSIYPANILAYVYLLYLAISNIFNKNNTENKR